MSESGPGYAAPTSPIAPAEPGSLLHQAERWALVALMLLAIVGIGVADFSATRGFQYWLAMVPVFAAVSLWLGWSRARGRGENAVDILWRQLLHWAGAAVGVYVVYRLQLRGRLDPEDAGLMTLLSLALVTALAGLHFDWRLGIVGGLLVLATLVASFVQQFFWVLLLPALAGAALLLFWRHPQST